ncbi:MAG: ABC transporter substrate-binding protein [Elainellaceae cyanobacterium]
MLCRRFNYLVMFAIGCGLALTACANSEPSSSSEPEVNLNSFEEAQTGAIAMAERLVALTSLSADLVYHLDSSKLVGVPGSSLIAGDARFEGIEQVSSERTPPNLEKVVALNPDLVIGAAGFHESTADRLKEAGIPTLLTEVDSWQSLQELTEILATTLDADPTNLLQRYDECSAEAPDRSPSTLVLVSYQPILSPNQDSWAGDFLNRFNIQNLTADVQDDSADNNSGQQFEGYISLSSETVLQADPDMLFVVNAGDDTLKQFEANPFWQELKATQTGNVHLFDYYGLINPGSLQSIEATCEKLSQLAPR